MSSESSAEQIAASPALLAEARAALPSLKIMATTAASDPAIMATIGRWTQNYPPMHMTKPEWANWWQGYYAMLAGISLDAIDQGLRDWFRANPTAEHLPKPNALRAAALAAVAPSARAYGIASAAERLEARRREQRGAIQPDYALTNPTGPRTAETRQAVADMAAAVTEKLRAPADKLPPLRRDGREPREITPEYRAMMNSGLEAGGLAPPTAAQLVAASLDGASQARPAPGRAISQRMIDHCAARGMDMTRAAAIRAVGGMPLPPPGEDHINRRMGDFD